MHILLTNDDGIQAPGIQALAEALLAAGHALTVCAPASEKSAVSHGLTMYDMLRATETPWPGARAAWAIHGTPADCVKLGLTTLIDHPVDLVVAGINNGANLGADCIYSGTVSAAMEGAMMGYPALATSLALRKGTPACFAPAAQMSVQIIEWMRSHPLPKGLLYNLNIPSSEAPVRGVRPAPLSRPFYEEAYECRLSPRGFHYYWLTGSVQKERAQQNSDASLIWQGYATLTPLTWDIAAASELAQMGEEPLQL